MQENEQQHKAIIWNTGPALVLAGPGSGKTFTTVERVRYLIEVHHVNPSNILVITFTKAAARQMRDRFFSRMESPSCPVTFGTFHAVFLQILKQSGQYNSNSILTEKEKREYLRIVLNGMEGEFPAEEDWEENLLSEIGFLKNSGQVPADFRSSCLENAVLKQVFLRFQRLLLEMRKLDLDDFAAVVKHLFLQHPDALKSWQQQFPYLLVDEFQDVNAVQYEVLKLLAGERRNLFVVGDDDQSIYGFRGSDPSVMRRFMEEFPEAVQINLSVNYRSRAGIVETAGKLISVNKERFPKQILAGGRPEDGEKSSLPGEAAKEGWKKLSPDGAVLAAGFEDRRLQAECLTGLIREYRNTQGNLSIAAIFRTNTDGALLAEKLGEVKIPFLMKEKVKSPYAHPVCRDLLAYLKFAKADRDRSLFFRIMNRPCRYLSRQKTKAGQISFPALLEAYRDKPYMRQLIAKMQNDITRIAGMDLFAAVNYVRKGIGYDDWIKREWTGEKCREGLEMAAFFQESVRGFSTVEQLETHLKEYEAALQNARTKEQTAENAVEIMTMHGAKGLEFDVVFLPDCSEGVVPHKKSASDRALEEERRMFYVGMTRAKKKLYLSWIKGTKEEPGFASRFLDDCGCRQEYHS